MGKSKSKSTVEPWAPARPYILGAAGAAQDAFNQNSAATQNIASQVQGLLPGLVERYNAGNPALRAAQGYNTDVLSGKYLNEGNPYLQGMIDSTGNDVRNGVQASLGTRGRTGGDSYFSLISKALADNSTRLRYADYGAERDRMAGAAGQVPGLVAAESANIAPLLAVAQAGTEIPYAGVNNYSANISRLLSPYSTTNTTQSQSFGSILGGVLGAGLGGWASGGFRGL